MVQYSTADIIMIRAARFGSSLRFTPTRIGVVSTRRTMAEGATGSGAARAGGVAQG